MELPASRRDEIVGNLREKATLKQIVYDNTFNVLTQVKEILEEYAVEANEMLEGSDRRIRLEYRDRGKHEAQLQMAGDILIFSMHTNVFNFERENVIWKNSYVQKDPNNSYCGVINIYNFLSDSFRYNRNSDEGYLIGRIFINREMQYLVEGKRQVNFRHHNFGTGEVTTEALTEIIESAVSYTLDFDLLVPPFDTLKIVSVEQMNTKIENSRLQTGKRMGYQYNSDDV